MLITEGITIFKRTSRTLSSPFLSCFLYPKIFWEEAKHFSRCFYRTEGKAIKLLPGTALDNWESLILKKICYKNTKTLISSETKKKKINLPRYPCCWASWALLMCGMWEAALGVRHLAGRSCFGGGIGVSRRGNCIRAALWDVCWAPLG